MRKYYDFSCSLKNPFAKALKGKKFVTVRVTRRGGPPKTLRVRLAAARSPDRMSPAQEPSLRKNYDFSNAIKNPYAEAVKEGKIAIRMARRRRAMKSARSGRAAPSKT
ncbi:MAG: hypothetical protein ACHQ49_02545 [Elusimicrobiota bacterium]